MKEERFLSKLSKLSQIKGIGDDGVLLDPRKSINPASILSPSSSYVVAMDSFCENRHFKLGWLSLFSLAKKAMMVNISDIVAMNALPKYALISIVLPKSFTNSQLDEIIRGLESASKEAKITIIGGDTITRDTLDFHITLLGIPYKKPLFRNTMRVGDLLAYSGELGSSYEALKMLLRYPSFRPSAKSNFVNPKPKGAFLHSCAKYVNACMDISDGLFCELNRLSKSNNLGFEFLTPQKRGFHSGEEYELVFSFPPKYKNAILRLAKRHRVKINIFAKAKRGRFYTKTTQWN